MWKIFWKVVASLLGTAVLTIITALVPITWSWAKYVLLLAIPIWVLSLWQIYRWPFIPRFYLSLRTKLRDFRRFAYILLSKRKILRTVHKDVSIRFNVEALTIATVNAKIENLRKLVEKNKLNNNQSGDENKTTKS